MNQELRYLFLAVGFFTRLPVPVFEDFKESELNHSAKYFPLVGIVVGAVAALAYWLCAQLLPGQLAVLLSMAATVYLTGGFHEDGFSDAVDGLGGGWGKEQVLAIMQDSRIGSYGAMALVFILAAKFLALSHVTHALLPMAMVAGHALSRFCAVMVMATQPYVRLEGKAKPLATSLSKLALLVAGLFGLFPLIFLGPELWYALLPVVIVWIWFSLKLRKRIGGYTGDCLGAMQQLTEVTFYLGLLAVAGIP